MKILIFIKDIFRKFPFLLASNVIVLLLMSFFGACSLVSITPVVDFLIHPDMEGASPITLKAVTILQHLGLEPTLINWLILLVVFVALTSAFTIFERYIILKTKYAVAWDIMHETFRDFFDAKWYFFSSGKQGVILNTFSREIIVVGDAFGAMATFFTNILQVVFFLILPFYLSWQVTLISLGCALIFAIPFSWFGSYSYNMGKKYTSASNDMCSAVQENVSLAKLILGFANQQRSIDNLKDIFYFYGKAATRSAVIGVAVPLLYQPFGIIMIAVALVSAKYFKVPISTTIVLLLALRQVASSIGVMTAQKTAMLNFFPSYEQVQRLRKKALELKQKSGSIEFIKLKERIELKRVSFAYPNHDLILSGINISIPKGKMIALVGESGAGKSTLIDIIMGFHEPIEGNVTIDGINLQDYNILSYRHRLGYVPQDSVLFNMSIKDNLLWAHVSASDEDIKNACIQSNAEEFIRLLPEGYDTLVGDRGVRLSGGQIQRIALARAILRKPELLILDEATSSLDTNSERLIQQAIEKIAKDTTVVVIAHRLSTIVNADYIYVLNRGVIAEEGTYAKLVEAKGHFNRMVELQVLEPTA